MKKKINFTLNLWVIHSLKASLFPSFQLTLDIDEIKLHQPVSADALKHWKNCIDKIGSQKKRSNTIYPSGKAVESVQIFPFQLKMVLWKRAGLELRKWAPLGIYCHLMQSAKSLQNCAAIINCLLNGNTVFKRCWSNQFVSKSTEHDVRTEHDAMNWPLSIWIYFPPLMVTNAAGQCNVAAHVLGSGLKQQVINYRTITSG